LFIHAFYTLDSPTPYVPGYDLICAVKQVIDPVRQLVCSYWHVDLHASPLQTNPPSHHSMSVNTSSTSVSPADKWLVDCFRIVGIDPTTTVESTSTPQRHCAAISPSTHPQSPSTLLRSFSPCTLNAFQGAPSLNSWTSYSGESRWKLTLPL